MPMANREEPTTWKACDQCSGAVASVELSACLRHLSPAARRRLLEELGGQIDARGIQISAELFGEILHSVTRVNPKAQQLRFDHATFSGAADFSIAEEIGEVSCVNARFTGPVTFTNVTTYGRALFRNAQFTGRADFSGGRFRAACTFRSADFFADATFAAREFSGTAVFEQATFLGPADFTGTRFWADALFIKAQFRSVVDFRRTRFAQDSRFRRTRFESGPPQCERLDRFDEAWWAGKTISVATKEHQTVVLRGSPENDYVDKEESTRTPVVFVASSTEGLPVANAFQESLEHDARVGVWTQGFFEASKYPLESLATALKTADFGVFLVTPDDKIERRGAQVLTARDNVIFELGMFVGGLGRERTFIVSPRGLDLHLPTDLLGINRLDYDPAYFSDNALQAIGPAANRIRRGMKDLGLRQPRPSS
jgi:predicted nucleotide-binding protein